MEDLTGKQFGAYHIVSPLGEGGMAAVYKAYQPAVDRYVALKVLPQHFAKDPQFIGRFKQEAKMLAKLQHPHILPVHDSGESDGYTYFVMPLIDGGDLADLMEKGALPLPEIGRIVSQVGDALDYAHAQGIVHRDIKPSNILLDQRGNCLLTDFGIAKLVAGSTSDKLTSTGHVIGTPSYMSPEQGLGKELDGRSDIYALGVILYEMMTGEVPFRAETPMAVMLKHIHDPLMSPREYNGDLPEAIERVVLKSMAKKPEDRYATAGEMVMALQGAIQSAAIDHAGATVPYPVAKSPTTRPKAAVAAKKSNTALWLGLAAILVLLLLGLGAFGLWAFSNSGNDQEPAPSQQVDTQALPPATATPELALPTAIPATPVQPTPTQVVQQESEQEAEQPAPTQPPSLPTQPPPPPQDNQQGQQPSPGDRPLPPQEAIDACADSGAGAACEVVGPQGSAQGVCEQIQDQLACIPEGGASGPPPAPSQ